MGDYIPVKKLSVEDQERIYKDLFREKPIKVKVDPGEDTLEDKLKKKEIIVKKHRRRNNIFGGVFFGSFLTLFGSVLFLASNHRFAPYRKDPVVVEYLDKKQQLSSIEYEKDKLLMGTGYTLEKILGDGAKKERVLSLQIAINMLQSDIKEKEGKEEVAAYNYFLDKTSPAFFLLGVLIGGSGVIGSFLYGNKNNKNKERELKALGF